MQEPEILVKQTAEMHARGTICGKTLSPSDKIARAIMHITSLYGQAIKKARGGWSCGTHMNHVRTALSHKIAAKTMTNNFSASSRLVLTVLMVGFLFWIPIRILKTWQRIFSPCARRHSFILQHHSWGRRSRAIINGLGGTYGNRPNRVHDP